MVADKVEGGKEWVTESCCEDACVDMPCKEVPCVEVDERSTEIRSLARVISPLAMLQ